ncbi:hypothetical protein HR11_10010 [Porphyromonas macacae]|nr:hypothetical protein HR11_10010 [Porphyromonas macacae]
MIIFPGSGKNKTACHHAQTTALPATFGFGHALQYALPFRLSLGTLYFTYSDTSKKGLCQMNFDTAPVIFQFLREF